MSDCLFCRIVSGDVPADIVARSANALAFRDINPVAPTHVLVVPTMHYANAAERGRHLGEDDDRGNHHADNAFAHDQA